MKFTEVCCSVNAGNGPGAFGEQYDPTMANALIVGRYNWQFLTIAQAESVDWWTAVSTLPCSPTVDGEQCATVVNNTAGYNDGLVSYDPNYNQTHDYNIYYTKRAFMMKHFALHRPGSVRYDVPQDQLPYGVNAIASKSGNTKAPHHYGGGAQMWNVLFMNNQTQAYNLTLRAPKHTQLKRVVETTNKVDFAVVNPMPSVRERRGSVPASGGEHSDAAICLRVVHEGELEELWRSVRSD